jgi:hypothetical protein
MVCAAIGVALTAVGCLSGSDGTPPGVTIDASIPLPDGGPGASDASGQVDGSLGPQDAAPDVAPVDATPPVDAGADTSIPDAGIDAADTGPPPDASGITGSATLVSGGTLSKSKGYGLNGTVGPASAPVMTSPKYRLVGGMAATSEKK